MGILSTAPPLPGINSARQREKYPSGGDDLEINIYPDERAVELWLSGEDARDISGICAVCRDRGFRVAVYRSGSGDLTALTSGILAHNRDAQTDRKNQAY